MKIYGFTQVGARVANTVNNPDTENWRVIHALKSLGGQATEDQIALYSGLDDVTVGRCLRKLAYKQIVTSN